MYIDFDEMPNNSRVWIYQSTQHLDMEHLESLSATLMNFLDSWQAHGHNLKASFTILHNRFIVVALDEVSYQATGCSIDKLVHLVQHLEKQLNLSLMDRMQVAFKEEGLILTMPMNSFREELQKGECDENTIVFNNLIETKGQLENQWETTVANSWHKQLLPIA